MFLESNCGMAFTEQLTVYRPHMISLLITWSVSPTGILSVTTNVVHLLHNG